MNIEKISNTAPAVNFNARCVILDRTKSIPKDIIKQCKYMVNTAGKDDNNVFVEFTNSKYDGIIRTYIQAFLFNGKNNLTRTRQMYCGISSNVNVDEFLNHDLNLHLNIPENTVELSTFKKAAPFLYKGRPLKLRKTETDTYGLIKDEFFAKGAERHYTYGYDYNSLRGLFRYISKEKYPDGTIKTYEMNESKIERLAYKDSSEFTNEELKTIEDCKKIFSVISENNNLYEANEMLKVMNLLKNANLLNQETLCMHLDNYESLLMTIPDILSTNANKKEYDAIITLLQSIQDINFNQKGDLDVTFFEKVLYSENMQLLDVIKQNNTLIEYSPVYEVIYKNVQNPIFKKALEDLKFDFTVLENAAKNGSIEAAEKLKALSNSEFMHYQNKEEPIFIHSNTSTPGIEKIKTPLNNKCKDEYLEDSDSLFKTLSDRVSDTLSFFTGIYKYIIKDPFSPIFIKAQEQKEKTRYLQYLGDDQLRQIFNASKNSTGSEAFKKVLKSCGIKEPEIEKFVSGEFFVTDAFGKLSLMHNSEKDPISLKLRQMQKDEIEKLKILYPEDNTHMFV